MKVVKPGQRLNAEMLGRNFVETVRIDRVVMEKCGEDRKPCLYFEGHSRALVLNATNIDTLVSLFGSDESDLWVGRAIQLYTTMTTYGGKPKLGIRVREAHYSEPAPSTPPPAPSNGVPGERESFPPMPRPFPAAPSPSSPRREREPGEDDGPVQASQIRW